MTTIKALGVALPMALLLGTALPTLAQQTRSEFDDFGCKFDGNELEENGVVPEGTFTDGEAFVGFITHKNCPGSQANPTIQMNCDIPLDPDPMVDIRTKNFTCLINGVQCGFAQTFVATNTQVDICSDCFTNDDGETVGLAQMRCSKSVTD